MKDQVGAILAGYHPAEPGLTAQALRELWLQSESKSIAVIKAEQRAQQETAGIPVDVLRLIGDEVGKMARKRVAEYLPLACLLWDEYGREGRVVAVYVLGAMEVIAPEVIFPQLRDLCATCLTWEDADQFAMRALEPIVRKAPERWLPKVEPWLVDENKWVRRAGVTVVGRLSMKHSQYTSQCLELIERLLLDEEQDVRRAVSFAIRLCARGQATPVRDFLSRHVPPENSAATWVLCDVIRSMTRELLPEFMSLLSLYEGWAADSSLDFRDRRSVESAIQLLKKVQG